MRAMRGGWDKSSVGDFVNGQFVAAPLGAPRVAPVAPVAEDLSECLPPGLKLPVNRAGSSVPSGLVDLPDSGPFPIPRSSFEQETSFYRSEAAGLLPLGLFGSPQSSPSLFGPPQAGPTPPFGASTRVFNVSDLENRLTAESANPGGSFFNQPTEPPPFRQFLGVEAAYPISQHPYQVPGVLLWLQKVSGPH